MSFLTSRSYSPGDVIHEEKPFVRVLKHDLWDKICAGCCDKSTGLKKCSGCSVMKYCGKSCQKNDWPDHKLECPYLRNYTDFRNYEVVHMIGKLILKLKGKDWKTATSRIFDVEVSFDDLLSQADYALQNLGFEALDITTPLESYIGKENVPDKEILRELFGKVITNRFSFFCGKYPLGNDFENVLGKYHDSMQIVGGSALFLGVSKLDHSCVPNAVYRVTGASITVRAIRTIKKFEKVTISYTNMIATENAVLEHEFITKFKFREKCYCSDCSQVPGESKLTKILDASKAFGVIQETEQALQLSSMPANYLSLNYRNPTVTRGYLKNLVEKQNEALGRTHLRRMQTLAKLYSPEHPEMSKEELRAGCVELTESMKEVWGDYHLELATYYRCLVNLNRELGNEKEARQYCVKLWRLESVIYGAFFINDRWEDALSEDRFRYYMEKISQE